MSMGATLSVLGLYEWDNTIFDLMQFPEGFTNDEKNTVIQNILAECAELEFLYPNPTVAKNIIGIWSKKELPYWNRVYSASKLEYNPIENYRRNEDETITDDKTEQHSGTDSGSQGGSDTQTTSSSGSSTESGTDTTTNKVAAFDSNTLLDHASSATAYGHAVSDTGSGSATTQYNRTNSLQHGEKIEHDGTTERNLLAYGNIGVTTSQEMLTQEMEVAKIINVVPIIIESFINRFCLLVY